MEVCQSLSEESFKFMGPLRELATVSPVIKLSGSGQLTCLTKSLKVCCFP